MALTGTNDNALRLHTYAPFTLLRAAIENAAIAMWVMSGPSREERIVRHLRHELTSILRSRPGLVVHGAMVRETPIECYRCPSAGPHLTHGQMNARRGRTAGHH
jgi:hypothetical protein